MSGLASKVKKAVTQPHKIPGFVQRRVAAILNTVEGRRIVWPAAGRAVLETFQLQRPAADEVLVLTEASLVSPGTERAMFARLPNTNVAYPAYPGYSAAGRVLLAGAASGFQPGDRVAAAYPHASVWAVKAGQALPVPEGVSAAEACFLQLGVIALQGVRKAQIQLGERVAVLGPGPIGLIAQQLAAAAGAQSVTMIAASGRRLALARELGAPAVIDLTQERAALAAVQADVTLEVTGNPEAFADALAATRPGGRIVLLGSPRGQARAADLEAVRAAGVTVIGAHIMSLPKHDPAAGAWTERQEGETFLRLLADGRLNVRPLVTERADPAEAERFYRRLADPQGGDRGLLTALFDWERLPERQRFAAPRREALQQGRVAEAVRGPGAPAPGKLPAAPAVTGAEGVLRIGLIGCGEIAMDNARAVTNAGNAALTAVMDVNAAVAEDMAKRYQLPFTTDAAALLARPDVDAVLLSVPHFLHAPLAIQALQAGKHVMVEKPMANSLAEADAMLAAAQAAGRQLSVMYVQRYLPYVQKARQLIEQGKLGRLLGLSLVHYLDKPISYWTGGRTGRVASDWRLSPERSGGGILVFNLVHYLDLMRHLAGQEVLEAFGTYGTFDSPSETEDTIAVTLRYAGGLVGSITGASCVRGAGLPHQQLRLWGTEGQVMVGEPFQFYSLHAVDDYTPGQWHTIAEWEWGAERREYVRAFARAVLRGETPPVSGADGRAIQALVAAIYASQERAAPVRP